MVPGQAESWTVSADGRQWEFRLRPDLHWSNGDRVTAEDFVASFRRLVDPATASSIAFLANDIVGAEDLTAGRLKDPAALGVTAPDVRTVQFALVRPDPSLPAILAVLRPSHASAPGETAFKPGSLVSNGAYTLAEWVPQSHVTLRRNPAYWDAGRPAIEAVEFDPIESEAEELKRYRAGEIDITDTVPYDAMPLVERDYASQYHVSPLVGVGFYGFNLTRPPFKDAPRLREALALAIDRQILAEKVVKGGVSPAYGFVPPGIDGYAAPLPDWAALPAAERIARARSAYAAAGYGPDHPLELRMLYNTGDANRRVAIALAAMWQEVLGVHATLENQEFKVSLETRKLKRDTQAFRGAFIAFYADPAPMLETLRRSSPYNDEGFDDPAYERLFDTAAATVDPRARLAAFGRAEARVEEQLPVIPLYFYTAQHLISPRVQGWQPSPLGSLRTQDLRLTPAP